MLSVAVIKQCWKLLNEMIRQHWRNDIDRVELKYKENPVPVPVCSPQIPNELPLYQRKASTGSHFLQVQQGCSCQFNLHWSKVLNGLMHYLRENIPSMVKLRLTWLSCHYSPCPKVHGQKQNGCRSSTTLSRPSCLWCVPREDTEAETRKFTNYWKLAKFSGDINVLVKEEFQTCIKTVVSVVMSKRSILNGT